MNSTELVKDYLKEVRVRFSVPSSEIKKSLVNLYKKTNKQSPPDDFFDEIKKDTDGSYIYVIVHLLKTDKLPGIHRVAGKLEVHDFEERFIKPLGWRIERVEKLSWMADGSFSIIIAKILKRKDKKPRYLYHAAPSVLKKRILREGLVPKSRFYRSIFWYSDPRIFLWTEFDIDNIHSMMKAFATGEKDLSAFGDELSYVVFRIDTDKFDRFNLFKDTTTSSSAVYTRTHVPPEALDVIYKGNLANYYR